MSDYFTRMAERATGKEAAIRPILSPAFVPGSVAAAGAPAAFPIGTGIEEEVFAPAVPESDYHRPDYRRQVIRAGSVSMDGPSSDLIEPPGTTHQENTAAPPVSVALPAEGPVAPASRAEYVHIAADKVSSREGPPHQPDEFSSAGENAAAGPTVDAGFTVFEAASSFIRTIEASRDRDELLTGRREERDMPHADREPPVAAGTARTGSIPAPPQPFRSAEAHLRDRMPLSEATRVASIPAENPAPPTIKVSIGRVEIRAAAPQAAPAESRRPPEPKLSLDDYLKKQPGRTG